MGCTASYGIVVDIMAPLMKCALLFLEVLTTV